MATTTFNYRAYIEGDSFLTPHRISEVLKSNLTIDVIGEERNNLIREIQCYDFYFKNGELCPIIEQFLANNAKNCYPNINRFSKEDVFYIENRLAESGRPFPRARYAHLIWMITKHNQAAYTAIDSYRSLVKEYYSASIDDHGYFDLFIFSLEALHYLSIASKRHLDECKSDLQGWLKDDKIPFTWRSNLLSIILDSPLFKRTDFLGLTNYMISRLSRTEQKYSQRDHYLQECLRLSAKEGASNEHIYFLLGENEMTLAKLKEDDESGLIRMSSYQKAAYYFKLAHNVSKFAEAVQMYTENKGKLQFKLFQHEFSHEQVAAINDELNRVVEKMLAIEDVSPLLYLVYNRHFLMDHEKLQNEAESDVKNSLAYFANTAVYDINNNYKDLDDQGKIAFQKQQNYSFHLQMTTVPLLSKFFYTGIRTGKLSRDKIMDFFNQTWFAKGLEGFSVDGEKEVFSWIELLGPGLRDLVSQLEANILDREFRPNYTLGIDSLSIKIEGIIRDLARIRKVNVTKIKEGESVEMNLEELFREESIIQLFKNYDILLFKFILTKSGWNVRNNCAHAFYRPGDYSEKKALLILLSVFRLCGYGDILGPDAKTEDTIS
jgi:hypothetical protein